MKGGGWLYGVDGSVQRFTLPESDSRALEQMQKMVGGYIELVPPSLLDQTMVEGRHVFVNERGRLEELPLNLKASLMLGSAELLVGPVLLMDSDFEQEEEEDV